MKQLFQSRILHVILTSLLLASCSSPSYTTFTENEIKILRQARRDYTTDGVLIGAATGAAIGAGSAALAGGDKKDIAKGAAIGGIAGGLGGGFAGFKKGDAKGKEQIQNRRLTSAERKGLDSLTKKAQSNINMFSGLIRKLNNQIAEGKVSIAQKDAKILQKDLSGHIGELMKNPLYNNPEGKAKIQRKVSELEKMKSALGLMAMEGKQQKI